MNRVLLVAEAIADAWMSGPSDIDGLVERGADCLGRKHRWLAPMCRRAFHTFGSSLAQADRRAVVAWIARDDGFQRAFHATRPPRVRHYFLEPPAMAPRTGALAACDLPSLATPGDLAAWLGITAAELDWFADLRGMNRPGGALAHYTYAWIPKREGLRLMEVPKHRLRLLQRQVLHGILQAVPTHHAAHGFRRGRSCLTFVKPHIRQDVVLRMDLRRFFTSIPGPRIHALFETLGYPQAVARLLSGLCTNAVPMRVARHGASSWTEGKELGVPHLPQGAPTSPALANLCALHLDLRLDGLAKSIGASYTRYADDLAISGGETLRRRTATLARWVARIALEEGFRVNERKTRTMHRSERQVLCGIVVNERANVPRVEFDRLKSILTNCARHGAAGQNREQHADFRAHLAGRVAHVRSLNPVRGEKLALLFERIDF